MKSSQPAVSVIIPCFNQGATLNEAVDSVLNQTFGDFEIVIVNDGSSDPFTNSLLGNYHRPKTRVIATGNRGLAEARNAAIRNSRGRYILPLDADDCIHREYLEHAVPLLENNVNGLIVYCDAERFGDETGFVELPEFSRKAMLFRNLIFCTALFRKSDYLETRGYNSNLVHAYEDWDFWLSLLELRPAGTVIKLPQALFNYRIHAGSMLNSLTETERRFSRMRLFLNHIALYEHYGIDPVGLYSADQELEKDCVWLENELREIRNSPEYRIGSLLLRPFGTAVAAIAREKFRLLKQVSLSQSSAAIKAIPNPIRISAGTEVGETTLSWGLGTANTVEIHVDAPDGPLFARATSPGVAVTGKWVRDGMTFYLQNVSAGLPLTAANTLATTRITAVTSGVVARMVRSLRHTTTSRRGPLRTTSGVILIYHRITANPLDTWKLNVTPRNFEGHLDVLQRYCRPWPLQRAMKALRNGKLPARTVVVTFDDGYRDNFVHAKPLLEKYDVPATLFLTSGYIESPRGFWWDEMERIFSEEKSAPAAFHSVYNRLQSMTDAERWTALDELGAQTGIARRTEAPHPTLSHGEVAAFDKSELVEVGSHTVTHPLLTALPRDLQREEILRGKLELEEILGHHVTSFAYPHGQYRADTVSLVEEAGFACGCSTDEGVLTRKSDRFRLPRIQVGDCDAEEFSRWISDWFERCAG